MVKGWRHGSENNIGFGRIINGNSNGGDCEFNIRTLLLPHNYNFSRYNHKNIY